MTPKLAELMANISALAVAVFFFLFDRSQGWAAGWKKFKADFLQYGWPIIKPIGAAIAVFTLVYGLLMVWA
ncbi:hypothetical protein [Serratia marcescens]